MQFGMGITYEYFFKGYPRHCFVLMGMCAEGYQSLVADSKVAKNISKVAVFFQMGHDFPLAFQSFRSVYYRYHNIKATYSGTEPYFNTSLPWWLEAATAVSSGAHLITFSQKYIFEQRQSSFVRLIAVGADLVQGAYFVYQTKLPMSGGLIGRVQSLKKEEKALLCCRFTFLFLSIISLYSVFRGSDNSAPLLTLFLTTVYIGSHFIRDHGQRIVRVKEDG